MAYHVSGGEVVQDQKLINKNMFVYSEGIAQGIVLNNGHLYVEGGVATGVETEAAGTNGYVYVYDNGEASDINIASGGIHVSKGGALTDARLYSGEIIVRDEGSIADGVTQFGGTMNVLSGASVVDVEAYDGVNIYISSGADAQSVNVHNGAFAAIYSGATVDGVVVGDGGTLTVDAGATVHNIDWNPLTGNLSVAAGADVTYTRTYTDVYFDGAQHNRSVISGSGKYVVTGVPLVGTLEITITNPEVVGVDLMPSFSFVVDDAGYIDMALTQAGMRNTELVTIRDRKKMYVMNEGVALGVNVDTGELHVWDGGRVSAVVMSGAAPRMYVSNGGQAHLVAMQQGELQVLSGGLVTRLIAGSPDARVSVHNGAVVNNTLVYAGAKMYVEGYVYNTGNINTRVNVTISVEGQTKDFDLNFGGKITGVPKDNNTNVIAGVSGGGQMYVSNGGHIDGIVVGGTWLVSTFGESWVVNIDDPEERETITPDPYRNIGASGAVIVGNNGFADNTLLHGVMHVTSGGVVENTNIAAATSGERHSSGFYKSTWVRTNNNGDPVKDNNGNDIIDSAWLPNGTFNSSYLSSGGVLHVAAGGIANMTTVGGEMHLAGIANSVTVAASVINQPYFEIEADYEVAGDITNTSSGFNYTSGGVLHISGGGIAHNVTNYGSTIVSSGGILHNVSVYKGSVTLQGGTLMGGNILDGNVYGGIEVGNAGGTLDFTIAEHGVMSVKGYLINDFTKIRGNTGRLNYTITVEANQADGVYGLARNIGTALLNKTITVKGITGVADGVFAPFAVNANNTAQYNNKFYTLVLDSVGDLSLVVSSNDPAYVKPDAPIVTVSDSLDEWCTKESITVTAAKGSYNTLKLEYSTDGGTTWLEYTNPIVVNYNSELVFRGLNATGMESEWKQITVDKLDNDAPEFEIIRQEAVSYAEKVTVYLDNITDYHKYGTNNDEFLYAKDNNGNFIYETDEYGKTVYEKDANGELVLDAEGNPIPVKTKAEGEIVRYEYRVKYEGSSEFTIWQRGTLVTVDRNCTIEFRVYDAAGNCSEIKQFVVDTIGDIIAPTISVSGNTEVWTNQDITLTAAASGLGNVFGSVMYSFDGGNTWNIGSEAVVTQNGTISFKATDAAGNYVIENVVVSKIDKNGPTAVITGNPAISTWVKEVVLDVTASDGVNESGIAGIKYLIDESADIATFDPSYVNWDEFEWSGAVPVTEATASITVSKNAVVYIQITDNAGNVYNHAEVVSRVDNAPPTINEEIFGVPTNKPYTVDLAEICSDDASQVSLIKWQFSTSDSEAPSEENWITDSTVVSITAQGFLWVNITDNAGNVFEKKIAITNYERVAPGIEFEYDDSPTNKAFPLTVKASDVSGIDRIYYRMAEDAPWVELENTVVDGNNASAVIENLTVGTVYIKVVDKAGNEGFGFQTLTNYDDVAPAFDVAGNPEEFTSESATLVVSGSDDIDKVLYRYDENWDDAENTLTAENSQIVVDVNKTVYIMVVDKAGNASEPQKVVIEKIDKDAPVMIVDYSRDVTNADVIVNVSATDAISGVNKILYRFGNDNWDDAENTSTIVGAAGKITVAQNSVLYVKVIDNVGKETVNKYDITSIDKLAPAVEVTGNPAEWTAGDAVLVISASDIIDATNLNITSGIKTVEYLDANGEWQIAEDNKVTVSTNGVVNIRVTDNAGNVTETDVDVTKLDKDAPVVEITGNPEEVTGKDVILNVNATDSGSGIKEILYRFGDDNWDDADNNLSCTDAKITVSQSGLVFVKVIDNVGRETSDSVYVKIDKVFPQIDFAYTDAWTKGTTTITASSIDADVVKIAYSFDNIKWTYADGASIDAVVSANGTVYFKAIDKAGNVSTSQMEVNWLDNDKPTFEVNGIPENYTNKDVTLDIVADDKQQSGIALILYRFDENWSDEASTLTAVNGKITLAENKTVYIKVIDNVGNESDVQSVVINKIDKDVAFEILGKPSEWVSGSVTLAPEIADDLSGIAKIEYKLEDSEDWIEGDSVSVDKNQTVAFRVTDNAGNTVIKYADIDKLDNDGPTIVTSYDPTWTNESVVVTAVAQDDKSGVSRIFYSYDNIEWFSGSSITVSKAGTVYFKAVDSVGNEKVESVEISNIDKDKPIVSVDGISAEWTAGKVILTAAGVDDKSGVVKYEYKLQDGEWTTGNIATVDKNQTVGFRVTDAAGNVAETFVDVTNIDKADPIVSISGNTSKWTNQNIILTGSAVDHESGIGELYHSFDNINWIKGATVQVAENGKVFFKAVDNVGNEKVEFVDVQNIDKVDPTVEITGNATTWTANSVTLAAAAKDNASGIAKVEYNFNDTTWIASNYAIIADNGTVVFRITDNAGNVTEETVLVNKIDKEGPEVTLSGAPSEWTNESVFIVASAADDKSGVGTIEYKINNSGWIQGKTATVDANATVVFRVTDKVGNVTESSILVNKIDKEDPTLIVSGNPTNWINGDVTLVATADDKASGVAKVEYNFNNTGWQNGTSAVITGNGTVIFRVTDNAGNVTTETIEVGKIDKEDPTLRISGDVTNWTANDVVLSGIAADAKSGIKEVLHSFDNKNWVLGRDATVKENGVVYFKAVDNVGNETVSSVEVTNIDKEDPTLAVTGNAAQWTNENVTLVAAAGDAQSGVAKVEYSINGSAWHTGSNAVVSSNGTVVFRVTDKVGNVTEETVVVDKIDKELPKLTIHGNVTEWTSKDVFLTASATDDKSGVKEVWYSFDNENWVNSVNAVVASNGTVYFKAIDNVGNEKITAIEITNIDKEAPVVSVAGNVTEWTNSNVVLVATADDKASGVAKIEYNFNNTGWKNGGNVAVTSNGTVVFRVTDNVGNVTEETVVVDKIDKASPVVVITGNATAWTKEDIVLDIAASDSQSGLAKVEYKLENGSWANVNDNSVVVGKNQIVEFRVTDKVGNVTTESVAVTKIDKDGPVISFTGNSNVWTNKDVVIVGAAADDKSGVKEVWYSFDNLYWTSGNKAIAGANGIVYFKAIDKVGNETVSSVEVKNIDKEAPLVSISGNATEWTNTNVILSAYAEDRASGLAKVEYNVNGTGWKVGEYVSVSTNGTVVFRVTDNVGNVAEETVVVDKIDKDAPSVSVSGNISDWVAGSVTLVANAADAKSGVDKVEYSINGANWQTGGEVEVNANGTKVIFRVTDNVGNVVLSDTVVVNNIDNEDPTVSVTGNATEWTNSDVVLVANAADAKSGVASVEYRIDGGAWQIGENAIVTVNGTVEFRVTDKVGNVYISDEIEVTKIDKENPTISISGNPTEWVSEDVILRADVADNASGVAKVEYRIGSGEWITGTQAVVTENGAVVFRVTDNAGNINEVTEIVTMIDDQKPVITVTGNATEWTNQSVTLTVTAVDNRSGVKQLYYSFDNQNWIEFDTTVTVDTNKTVYFKAVSNIGRVGYETVEVTKIDKELPVLTITGNATEWTTQSVTLSVSATDTASGIDKVYYSLDNISWEIGSSVTVKENGTVYFRATDMAGNVKYESVVVDKIDRGEPAISVTANTTEWTNKDVVLTAAADDSVSGIAKIEYSLDNVSWNIGNIVTVGANGTVYFRATDNIGNVSVKEFAVSNIDKVDPTLSLSGNATEWTNQSVIIYATATDALSGINGIQYSFDNSTWFNGAYAIVDSNCTVYFKTTDNAGNVVEQSVVVDKIDTTGPSISVTGIPEENTRKPITLVANATDDGSGVALIEYSLDNVTWVTGSSVTVKTNGTVYFRATDNIGNVSDVTSVEVDKIIEVPGGSNILTNGTSQIVGWDMEQGKVGYIAVNGEQGPQWSGVYEWNRGDAIKWKVAGVGHFAGSQVDYDGILLYNSFGDTFAAWTDLNNPTYGYVSLCHVGNNFETQGLANLDGNKYDDILIYDEKGSFGVVLDGTTYKDIWHVEDPANNEWKLVGSGLFGGNVEKLIVENTSGHLYLWENNDATFSKWDWTQEAIGYLGNEWEFVAAGDFMGDGTDDIIVRKVADNGLWMWDNGKSSTAHWVVTPEDIFKPEAVGDYNGDGKDDLLVREYQTGWGGLGYYAFGSDQLWNDLNARIETDLDSKFTIIA